MAIKKVSITYEDDTEATFVGPLDLASLPTESPVAAVTENPVQEASSEALTQTPQEVPPTETPSEVPATPVTE